MANILSNTARADDAPLPNASAPMEGAMPDVVVEQQKLDPTLRDYIALLAQHHAFTKNLEIDRGRVMAELADFWPEVPQHEAEAYQLWQQIDILVKTLPAPQAGRDRVLMRVSAAPNKIAYVAMPEPNESVVVAAFDSVAGIVRRATLPPQEKAPPLNDMGIAGGVMVECQSLPGFVNHLADSKPFDTGMVGGELYTQRARDPLLKGDDPVAPKFTGSAPRPEMTPLTADEQEEAQSYQANRNNHHIRNEALVGAALAADIANQRAVEANQRTQRNRLAEAAAAAAGAALIGQQQQAQQQQTQQQQQAQQQNEPPQQQLNPQIQDHAFLTEADRERLNNLPYGVDPSILNVANASTVAEIDELAALTAGAESEVFNAENFTNEALEERPLRPENAPILRDEDLVGGQPYQTPYQTNPPFTSPYITPPEAVPGAAPQNDNQAIQQTASAPSQTAGVTRAYPFTGPLTPAERQIQIATALATGNIPLAVQAGAPDPAVEQQQRQQRQAQQISFEQTQLQQQTQQGVEVEQRGQGVNLATQREQLAGATTVQQQTGASPARAIAGDPALFEVQPPAVQVAAQRAENAQAATQPDLAGYGASGQPFANDRIVGAEEFAAAEQNPQGPVSQPDRTQQFERVADVVTPRQENGMQTGPQAQVGQAPQNRPQNSPSETREAAAVGAAEPAAQRFAETNGAPAPRTTETAREPGQQPVQERAATEGLATERTAQERPAQERTNQETRTQGAPPSQAQPSQTRASRNVAEDVVTDRTAERMSGQPGREQQAPQPENERSPERMAENRVSSESRTREENTRDNGVREARTESSSENRTTREAGERPAENRAQEQGPRRNQDRAAEGGADNTPRNNTAERRPEREAEAPRTEDRPAPRENGTREENAAERNREREPREQRTERSREEHPANERVAAREDEIRHYAERQAHHVEDHHREPLPDDMQPGASDGGNFGNQVAAHMASGGFETKSAPAFGSMGHIRATASGLYGAAIAGLAAVGLARKRDTNNARDTRMASNSRTPAPHAGHRPAPAEKAEMKEKLEEAKKHQAAMQQAAAQAAQEKPKPHPGPHSPLEKIDTPSPDA